MDGQVVEWTSSDTSIARVNERGVVSGERVGDATIIASVDDKSGTSFLHVAPGVCTRASAATIEIGQKRTGILAARMDCTLQGEPSQGWQFKLEAPTLLQIDLSSNLYFAHIVLTDAQMKLLVDNYSKQLRRTLPAGDYIVWVASDFEDGFYELTVNALQSGN